MDDYDDVSHDSDSRGGEGENGGSRSVSFQQQRATGINVARLQPRLFTESRRMVAAHAQEDWPLRVDPGEIRFESIEPGVLYVMSFSVRNATKAAQRIRIRAPKSGYFALNYIPAGVIAPGIDVRAEIECQLPATGTDLRFLDSIVVSMGQHTLEVPLYATKPSAEIRFDPLCNLGYVAEGQFTSVNVPFENAGQAPSFITFRPPAESRIKINPAKLELPPRGKAIVVVSFEGKDLGPWREFVQVDGTGMLDPGILDVTVQVVDQKLNLLAANNGGILDSVEFGALFYGESKVINALLVNTGPQQLSFSISYDDEMAGALASGGHPQTEEGAAAQLIPPLEKLMTLMPAQGVIKPFSQVPVRIKFSPALPAPAKGFVNQFMLEAKEVKFATRRAVIDCAEMGQRIRMTMQGSAASPSVIVSPTMLRFGGCAVNDRRDILVTIVNKSASVTAFEFSKLAHFKVSVESGKLQAFQSISVIFSFTPTQLGSFKNVIRLSLAEGISTIELKVLAEADQTGKKTMVGGVDALPEDFHKALKFVDPEEIAAMRQAKKEGRRMLSGTNTAPFHPLQDDKTFFSNSSSKVRDEIYALDDSFDHKDLSDEHPFKMRQAHNRTYTQFLQQAHATRLEAKREAARQRLVQRGGPDRGDPYGVDMGMDRGLEEPDLKVPLAGEPLWLKNRTDGAGGGGNRSRIPTDENRLIQKKYPSVAATAAEMRDCAAELSLEDLVLLPSSHKTIDFGRVCVGSVTAKSFCITNDFSQSVLVRVESFEAESKQSKPEVQIVPPGCVAGFDIYFTSKLLGKYKKSFSYKVNGHHSYTIGIAAEVVPIELEMNKTEMVMEFPEDSVEPSLSQDLFLKNPGNAVADFLWGSSGAFVCKPDKGSINPGQVAIISIIWTPSGDKRNKEELALNVTGGVDKTLTVSGIIKEVKAGFEEKKLSLGLVAVGAETKLKTTIKNSGQNSAVFFVDHLDERLGIRVTPEKGIIPAGESLKLEVLVVPKSAQNYENAQLSVSLRGGKPISIKFTGESVVPALDLKEREFQMGWVAVGSEFRLPMTISNKATIAASLILDLTNYQDFKPSILGPDAFAEISPEQSDASNNSIILVKPIDDGSLSPNSAKKLNLWKIRIQAGATLRGSLVLSPTVKKKYNFKLPLHLQGLSNVSTFNVDVTGEAMVSKLAISSQMVDFGDRVVSRDPLARATYFIEVYFRSLDPQKGFSYEIKETPEETALLAAAAEDGTPPTFFISPVRGDLAPNQSSPVRVTFQPQASGGFTKRLNIYVSGQPDPDRPYYTLLCRGSGVYPRMTFSRNILELPVVPLGVTSRATVTLFNNGYSSLAIKHKVSPAITIPLDVAFPDGNEFSITTDRIRVIISARADAPCSWSGKIEFLDNDGERFVINVSGCSDNSIMTNFPFVKEYSGDYGFLGLDAQAVQYMRKSEILALREQEQRRKEQLRKQRALERQGKLNGGGSQSSSDSKKKKLKEEASVDDSLLRVDDGIEGVDPDREVDVSEGAFDLNESILVLKWLNRNICRIPFDDERFPACIIETHGDIVVDCIEQLSGKKIAGIKPGTDEPDAPGSAVPGSRRSERPESSQISPANAKLAVVNRLIAKYQTIISYLVRAGALLNHINPASLLSLEDYLIAQEQELKRTEGNRFTRNVLADNQVSWNKTWLLNCKNGWMDVLFQSIKVFTLSRVTYAGYTSMPGVMLAAPEDDAPADGKGKAKKKGPVVPAEFTKSNVYSQAESVLLAWLSYHVHHTANLHDEGAEKASSETRLVGINKRLCDFDADLKTLFPFLQVMHSHLPDSAKHGGSLFGYTAIDKSRGDELFGRLMAALEKYRMSFDFAEDELVSSSRTLLLLALHLFLNLPSLLPKAKVEFKGAVGASIAKTIELRNPSKKKVVYNVTLTGSADFSVQTKELVLLPESTADFQVTLKGRFFEPVSATITFWGVRDAGVAGSTMVFQLVSSMTGRKPEASIKCTASLFEMDSAELTIVSPFAKDCIVPVRMLHHHAPLSVEDALKGNPVNPKTRGLPSGSALIGDATGSREAAKLLAEEDKEMEKIFRSPFWAEDTVQLTAGGSKSLVVHFLPFLMGIHTCHVVLLDPVQGEFCYEIVLEVGLPKSSEKLDFSALRDGSTTQKMVRFSSKNALFEKALTHATEVRLSNPAKKAKARSVINSLLASSVEDEVTGAASFAVEVLSPFFTVPRVIPFVSEYSQASGGPASPGARPDTQGNKFKKVLKTSLDAVTPQDVAAPGLNGALLSFNPDRAGTYAAQVALFSRSNKCDLRIFELHVVVTMPDAKIVLEFKGPARQKLSQDIPIQNTSGRDWNLLANVSGRGFAGPKSLAVPRGDKAVYPLTFTGPYAGSFEGTLSLANKDGEHNDHFDYALVGVADEPLAEDHLHFKCKARTRQTLSIALNSVPRPAGGGGGGGAVSSGAAAAKAEKRAAASSGAAQPSSGSVVFDIQTDLPYVTGPAHIEIGSGGAVYEFSILCPVGGIMSGSISFTDPTSGALIWYTVDVEVTAPMPESTIEVAAVVRTAVAVEISLENPTKETLVFQVTTEGEGLLGDATYSLPVGQSSSFYELIYSPLIAGESVGKISFFNDRVGEFWYRLHLVSTAAPPTVVPAVECMMGDTKTVAVPIENPLSDEVILSVSSSDPEHFFVVGDEVVLGPYSQSSFALQFRPSSLTDVMHAEIVLSHPDFGSLQYHVSGKGLLPGVMPSAQVFSPLGEVGSYTISFRNPFPNALPVDVVLNEEEAVDGGGNRAFSLLLRKTGDIVIPAKSLLQISVGFSPLRLGEYAATVNLRSNIGGRSLLWCFPVGGIAEAGSPQVLEALRTPCKTSLLRDVDIYLKGLRLADLKAGDVVSTAEFSLELVVADKSKPLVARSFRAQPIELVTLPETHAAHGTDFILRYRLLFEPLRTFSASIEMLLESKNRGRWRLELEVEGTEPEPDDVIALCAAVGSTDKVSFRLSNRFLGYSTFQAYFSVKSSPHFSVSPTAGVLAPYGSDGSTFVVSFAPATYGLREMCVLYFPPDFFAFLFLTLSSFSLFLFSLSFSLSSPSPLARLPQRNPHYHHRRRAVDIPGGGLLPRAHNRQKQSLEQNRFAEVEDRE